MRSRKSDQNFPPFFLSEFSSRAENIRQTRKASKAQSFTRSHQCLKQFSVGFSQKSTHINPEIYLEHVCYRLIQRNIFIRECWIEIFKQHIFRSFILGGSKWGKLSKYKFKSTGDFSVLLLNPATVKCCYRMLLFEVSILRNMAEEVVNSREIFIILREMEAFSFVEFATSWRVFATGCHGGY
jgi:hypothetical protein